MKTEKENKAKVMTFDGIKDSIKSIIQYTKSIDELQEKLLTPMLDINSDVITAYKEYKGVQDKTKKEALLLLLNDIKIEISSQLNGTAFKDDKLVKSIFKNINLVIDLKDFVIDLHFSFRDTNQDKVKLLSTIQKLIAVEGENNEPKIYNAELFIKKGKKVELFSKTKIKNLSQEKTGNEFTFAGAKALDSHLREVIKENKETLDKYFEAKEKEKLEAEILLKLGANNIAPTAEPKEDKTA